MARTASGRQREDLKRALKEDAILVLLSNALETERALACMYEAAQPRAAAEDEELARTFRTAKEDAGDNARALEAALSRLASRGRAPEAGPPPVCALANALMTARREGVLGVFFDLQDLVVAETAARGTWEVIRELALSSGSEDLLRLSEDITPREEAHVRALRDRLKEGARELFLFAESEVVEG